MEFTNPKKQKVTEEDDPFDELSDSTLLVILSLMPTKDAFRTCLISKRWQSLSTLIDTFDFTVSDYPETQDFSFVYNALAHSLAPKIKKFQIDFSGCDDSCQIDCTFRSEYNSLVTRCFSFAVERQVEDVLLWLCDGDECTLPESLYTCSSLINLNLASCGFNNDAVISWNSLKSIKLGYLVLADDDIVKLLAGCPALETMELYSYWGFRRLEINSQKLKTLKLKDYYWFAENKDDIEILAPYLQHLEISGDFCGIKCTLLDVSSVVVAKLIFNMTCMKDIQSFNEEDDDCHDYHQVIYTLIQDNLQKLHYATELTLGSWFTQVMCMLQFKGVPVSQLNCKYLTLELRMEKFNLYGVAGILRASPHVETLNIDMQTTVLDDFRGHFLDSELLDLAKGDNMDLQSGASSVEFHNLKKVKIVISSKQCLKDHVKWGFKKISKLSEFLLKQALVLEKFVIISKRRSCGTCSMNCLSQYLSRLTEKLLGCPRSSTNCVIIIQEGAFHDLTTSSFLSQDTRSVALY